MTHAAATSSPVTPWARTQSTSAWRVSFAALIGAVTITIFVLWLQPPPPPFQLITSNDYERRTKRFAFVRDARAWMTRFSPKIFGFAPVQISASYVIRDNTADLWAQLPLPAFSTNAVRVWILKSNEVARFERDLRDDHSRSWRVTTSEGIPSGLSMGNSTGKSPGSVQFANHPKIRGGNVDLAARFTVVTGTGDARAADHTTNQIAFRLFLKRDEGGILFDGSGVLFIWAHAP